MAGNATDGGDPAPIRPVAVLARLGQRAAMTMRSRLSVCARKARYRTREEALVVAKHSGAQLRTYRCDRCRFIHLTSRLKGKRVARPHGKPPPVANNGLQPPGT